MTQPFDVDQATARAQEQRYRAAVAGAQAPLEQLRAIPDQLATLMLERRVKLGAIQGDLLISAQGQAQRTEALTADLLRRFQALQQAARRAKEQIEGALQIARAQAGSTAEVTLAELRDTRIWARQQLLLAGNWDPDQLVDRAAAAGDLATLQVLRAELPTYIAAGMPGDPHRATEATDALLVRIAAAEAPLLPPGAAGAYALERELAEGWYALQTDFAYAEAELAGTDTFTLLLGWQKGTTVQVVTPLNLQGV